MQALNDAHNGYYLKMVYGDYSELWGLLQCGEIDMLVADERNDDYSTLDSELIETSTLVACFPKQSEINETKSIDIKNLSGYKCVIIADKQFQEREKEYFRHLLNFHGSFDIAKDIADSVTHIVDTTTPSFFPLARNNCAPNFYNRYSKILTLTINRNHIPVNYKLFWHKDHEQVASIAHSLLDLIKDE